MVRSRQIEALEVRDQGRKGWVEDFGKGSMSLVIIGMGIPAVQGHFNQRTPVCTRRTAAKQPRPKAVSP